MRYEFNLDEVEATTTSLVPTASQISAGIPIPPVRLLQVLSAEDWEQFTEECFRFTKRMERINQSNAFLVLATWGWTLPPSRLLRDSQPPGTAANASITTTRSRRATCTEKSARSRYLLGLRKDSQVIVVENQHPPEFVASDGNVIVFPKNPHNGRYGFFPTAARR